MALVLAAESGSDAGALHAALILSAALGAGATLLLALCVERLSGRTDAALGIGTLYALHPTAVLESVNGLETALSLAALGGVFLLALGWAGSAAPVSRRRAVAFGLCGGAAMLARTDAIFVWAFALGALALRSPRQRVALLWAGATSSALVAPWLIWNWLEFGSVVQISAVAVPQALRAGFLEEHGHGLGVQLERSAWMLQNTFARRIPRAYLAPPPLPPWSAGLALLAVLGALAARRRSREWLARIQGPAAGVVAGLAFHAGLRWWLREWYLAPAGWLLALLLGLALAALLEAADRGGDRRGRWAVLAALGAAAALLLTPQAREAFARDSPHRVQQLEAARWLAANTPPDARVGAMNAGILAYYSGRTVVNLDGAVNAEAYRAKRAGRLMEFALERGLTHLVDWRGTLPLIGCGRDATARCLPIAVIGEALPNFAGSPIWVVRIEAR